MQKLYDEMLRGYLQISNNHKNKIQFYEYLVNQYPKISQSIHSLRFKGDFQQRNNINSFRDAICRVIKKYQINPLELYFQALILDKVAVKLVINIQWNQLNALEIIDSSIQESFFMQIGESKPFIKLQKLLIFYCQFKLQALIHLYLLKGIKFLYLKQCSITNYGLRQIIKLDLYSLQNLDLSNNKVTNDGFKYLAQSNWPHLSHFIFFQNYIEDQGFHHFPYFNKLQLEIQVTICNVRNRQISYSGFKWLIKMGTKIEVKVKWDHLNSNDLIRTQKLDKLLRKQ